MLVPVRRPVAQPHLATCALADAVKLRRQYGRGVEAERLNQQVGVRNQVRALFGDRERIDRTLASLRARPAQIRRCDLAVLFGEARDEFGRRMTAWLAWMKVDDALGVRVAELLEGEH